MAAPERVSALEATFLALSSPEVPFVPGCVLGLDHPLALGPLRARIETLLAEIPRYRQRIARAPVLGSLAWVDDDDFDIARHVGVLRVPPPGSDHELDEVVARLLTAALPEGHPPWQLWTVEGLADGRGALIAMVHHALVDGVAGIGLLERMLRVSPERGQLVAVEPRADQERPRRPLVERVRARIAADLRGRAAGWRRITTQLQAKRHSSALVELLRQALHPSSDLGLGLRRNSRERTFATFAVPLDDIKTLKRAFGVTVNDVLVACIGGALRRYLAYRGVDVARLTDVRAMVPVSRHTRDEHATSGNRVTLLLVRLAVDEPDSATRVRRVAATTKELKQHDIAGAGDMLVALSDVTWSGLLTNTFRIALAQRAFNIGITNVPGPPIPLYMLDAQVTRFVPIMNLWPGIPLAIGMASYAGVITLGLDADRAAIADLVPFVDCLGRELDALRTATTTVDGVRAATPPS